MTVDDSTSVRQMVAFTLKNGGYEVIEAEDGVDALAKAKYAKVSMVLTDLNMPGMGGQNCLAQLIRFDPDIKVIVASGYPPNDKIKKILEPVVGGYIAKPYRLTDMMQKVRELLDCN